MGKRILDSKILYIFLSVILSIALWFYVTSLDDNLSTKPIRNIPITFAGEDILAERNLMITSSTPTATVEVRATPAVLWKLDDDTIRLTVNVSQITEAAEYTLSYTASLPAGVSQSDVEFISGQTGNVTFTVSRFTSRDVEVYGRFEGTVAEGYLAGENDEFIFAPKTVKISGQANLVNQVDHVLVTINGENLSDTVNGEYPFQLIGVDGTPLEDIDVTCSEETVYVTYPIWETKEIDLVINFITGGGVSEKTINYTMTTDRIVVAGSKEAVESITDGAITLATINLATVHDGDELTYPIPLADELINISGINDVTVTIDLPNAMTTQTVHVTDINCINLPVGWQAQVITRMLSVEVRGLSYLMFNLSDENVRVIADLKDVPAVAGQYTVPVRIYLDSVGTAEQIGIMGTDYKAVVSISEVDDALQASENG